MPVGPYNLWPVEHVEIAVERLHVDRHDDGAACAPSISTGRAMRVRLLDDRRAPG